MSGISKMPARQDFVEYVIGGRFFPEYDTRPVETRDPERAAGNAPGWAYAFRFYSVATDKPKVSDDFDVIPKRLDVSPLHYIGGAVFSLEEVEAMGEDHAILASNMRGNDWPRVIRCRTGNWQPYNDEQIVRIR